ncbi:hypothetical protein RUND412_006928 [Rhizina undulata]
MANRNLANTCRFLENRNFLGHILSKRQEPNRSATGSVSDGIPESEFSDDIERGEKMEDEEDANGNLRIHRRLTKRLAALNPQPSCTTRPHKKKRSRVIARDSEYTVELGGKMKKHTLKNWERHYLKEFALLEGSILQGK